MSSTVGYCTLSWAERSSVSSYAMGCRRVTAVLQHVMWARPQRIVIFRLELLAEDRVRTCTLSPICSCAMVFCTVCGSDSPGPSANCTVVVASPAQRRLSEGILARTLYSSSSSSIGSNCRATAGKLPTWEARGNAIAAEAIAAVLAFVALRRASLRVKPHGRDRDKELEQE